MMNHEERLAKTICRVLAQGTEQIDPWIAERLRAARERALQMHPALAPSEEVAFVGNGELARAGEDGADHPWRTAMAILALVFGMVASYYWNAFAESEAVEEIDSALLADDLSPKAYIDPGFQAWLSHFVQSAAR